MSNERQFCTFYLAGHCFGVEVDEVQEVLRHQDMTAVPLAGPEVGGLMNLRGQIVTAVDLRERLGLPKRSEDETPMNVVIRTEEGAVSLLVDQIGDVLMADESSFERPPETLSGHARRLILGAYKLDGRLLLVLDTQRAIDLAA